MNFKEIYTKYNTLGILTDEELNFLIEEYSKLDAVIRDKECFIGVPTVYVVGIELHRLLSIRTAREYYK